MVTLRTQESNKIYTDYLQNNRHPDMCELCSSEPVKEFLFWKIIQNDFPYDRIAKVHHMIVPKRHVSETQLNSEEMAEIGNIKKDYINNNYQYIIEATQKNKSVPEHFHLHLIIAKD